MRRWSILIWFVLLLWTGQALAGERPLLAVLDFQGSEARLKTREQVELTELARKYALDFVGHQFDIITRENLVDLLKSHGKTLDKCQGECETETGRLIGADVVVSGSVRKVFGDYSVALKAHSTSPPRVLAIEKASSKRKRGLPVLIKTLSKKLFLSLVGESSRKATPTPSPEPHRSAPTVPSQPWRPETGGGEGVLVRFESDPPGAVVMVGGAMICQSTPCQREVPSGSHAVEMLKDEYEPYRVRSKLVAQGRIKLKLKPKFGTLSIVSTPLGLAVSVDDKKVGVTPIDELRLSSGRHSVQVQSPCHKRSVREISVAAGARRTVRLSPAPRPAGLRVMARDVQGNDLSADVYVDGRLLGRTPKTFKVSACAKKLEVKHASAGRFLEELRLQERKTRKVVAHLKPDHGSARVLPAGRSKAQRASAATAFVIEQVFSCDSSNERPNLTNPTAPGCPSRRLKASLVERFIQGNAVGTVDGAKSGGIKHCFSGAFGWNQSSTAEVTISFQILPSGRTHDSTWSKARGFNQKIIGCVVGRISAWKFPKLSRIREDRSLRSVPLVLSRFVLRTGDAKR